jgi:hypothetical protein
MMTRITLSAVILSTVALVGSPHASAQSIDPAQRYLLLATERTATMQKELNDAANQGFRVLMGSPTSGTEMVLFLERTVQPPDTYSYRLLATTNVETMERELNEAAQQGFRLLPQTAISQASAGRRILGGGFAGSEIIVVVERAPKAEQRYQYKLLATSRTGTMQKEVSQHVAMGFQLVALLSRDEHMVVMERQQ